MDVRRTSTCVAVLAVVAASSAGCGSHGTSTQPDRGRTAIALAELRGRIVFSRFDDIWTANADGSAPRRLTTRRGAEFDPSWAPGGEQIAYRDSRRGFNHNDDIYVMNADGSGQQNLTGSR